MNQYEWIEIKKGYKAMGRVDVSIQELKNKNWTITYP